MSKLCPFCDGQGEIYRVVVKQTNETIFLCGECDTVWLNQAIAENNATNLTDYMAARGLEPLWSELDYIEKI